MYGFIDELEKDAGWGKALGEVVIKHIKPDVTDAARGAVMSVRGKVQSMLKDPNLVQRGVEAVQRGVGAVTAGGGAAAEGGKKYLKQRGKNILGRLGTRLQEMSE